jgi:uncharacterized protein (TIGR00106 family)
MSIESHKVFAEISIIPLGKKHSTDTMTDSTSISKEVSVAFEAIQKIPQVKVTLNAMGTEIESNNIKDILKSIDVVHHALKDIGIKRIISSIRIDERLDKSETLEGRINSVKEKLK